MVRKSNLKYIEVVRDYKNTALDMFPIYLDKLDQIRRYKYVHVYNNITLNKKDQ